MTPRLQTWACCREPALRPHCEGQRFKDDGWRSLAKTLARFASLADHAPPRSVAARDPGETCARPAAPSHGWSPPQWRVPLGSLAFAGLTRQRAVRPDDLRRPLLVPLDVRRHHLGIRGWAPLARRNGPRDGGPSFAAPHEMSPCDSPESRRLTRPCRPQAVWRAFLWVFTGALEVVSDGLDNLSLQRLSPMNNVLRIYT